jgi:hypothetical protein
MHCRKLRLGLRIITHIGQPAETLFEPLGYRHLRHRAAKDKLAGGIEKPVRQRVDDVIPGAGLDLIERLGRSGRPLPGSKGTIERSASERRGMTPTTLQHPARNPKNLARNPLKGQHPSATSCNPGKMHVSERKWTRAGIIRRLDIF